MPGAVRQKIFNGLHGARVGGHTGRERTLAHIWEMFYWPGMARDVRHWCRWCKPCARAKTGKPPMRHSLQQKPVGMPMERLATDIMVPFLRWRREINT